MRERDTERGRGSARERERETAERQREGTRGREQLRYFMAQNAKHSTASERERLHTFTLLIGNAYRAMLLNYANELSD